MPGSCALWEGDVDLEVMEVVRIVVGRMVPGGRPKNAGSGRGLVVAT